MFLKLSVLCLLVQAISGQVVDYCDKTLCLTGTHIGCNNNGLFNTTCNTPVLVSLSQVDKDNFVGIHNYLRNMLASGAVPGYQPAIRMATIRWDDTLAKVAEFNVKRCFFGHDSCRNTKVFVNSGQSLFMTRIGGILPPNVNATINSAVYSWASEYQYTNQANMDKLNSYSGLGKEIGHFLAIALEVNTHIGCAYSTFRGMHPTFGLSTGHYVACNYANSYLMGLPIYRKGPAASKCLTGKNPKYTSLCSLAEVV